MEKVINEESKSMLRPGHQTTEYRQRRDSSSTSDLKIRNAAEKPSTGNNMTSENLLSELLRKKAIV